MRIIWKDSFAKESYKPIRYRGYTVLCCQDSDGWITDKPDDYNIYKNHYCALNAIDKYHGGKPVENGSKKHKSYGIQIIGQHD